MSEGSLWTPIEISREYFIVQWNLYGPHITWALHITWGMAQFVLNVFSAYFLQNELVWRGHFREADIYEDLVVVH